MTKRAIRTAAMDFENSHIDEITEYFAAKDMNNFLEKLECQVF